MNGLEVYKKVGQSPILSKKIKDIQKTEVGYVVKYICAVTGITKVPEGYESKVLINFIIGKYQNYGILEFKTAFDMYAEGKLPKRDGESHYNTISSAFVGNVMQKYQTHRIKQIRELEKVHTEKPTPKATYTEQDFENAYNYAIGYISKENKLPVGGNWLHIYSHFKAQSMGWYGLEKEARVNAKGEFMDVVKKQLNSESHHKDIAAQHAQTALSNSTIFATECKMRYVKKELQKLIK